MPTQADLKLLNETLLEQLDNPSMCKQAVDAVNDFTRTKMREDGFYRRILPALPITNDELDRQVDTDLPVKVIDKEPDSPASVSLPFNTLPVNFYIRGPRYRVMFSRILTPRAVKDVDQLRTWSMDIRQVLSDNMIKDMLAEEDSKFITAINTALLGQGTVVPLSGVVQWEAISGGITRETVAESLKVMPRTPSHFEVEKILANNVTNKELLKWGRDEMGGDISEEIVKNGWAEAKFMGKEWVFTIKRDLVPDDRMYQFAAPKFVGKSFELESPTMFIRREAFMLEYFSYETIGGALGHTSGLAIIDFT